MVRDVICTSGPGDKPFEERHSGASIAIVLGGTFQYRTHNGSELMTPGSVLLGNAGECFECGHEHAAGDRCIAFTFSPEYFEEIAGDLRFRVPRLPAMRALSSIVARASAALAGESVSWFSWEEFGIRLLGSAIRLGGSGKEPTEARPSAVARVTRAVRMIESNRGADLTLETLAREARLSRYHFLRTFETLTGVTPHQYSRRTRLREAATRLATTKEKVLDIALDCGFGDVSNFNKAFRGEFGVSPRQYRA